MKKFSFIAILTAILLMLSACGINNTLTQEIIDSGEPVFDDNNGGAYKMYPAYSMKLDGFNSSEKYISITPNGYRNTLEQSTEYISLDSGTSSYPNLRSMINNGYTINTNAVKIDEMLNYFNFDYERPVDGAPLAVTCSIFDAPYAVDTKLLSIGLCAEQVELSALQNNIVLLIDVSGSMFGDDRLGLIQNAFQLIVEQLNENDRISIVTYAGNTRVALDGAYGYEGSKICAVLSDLTANGSTNGAGGLQLAYETAEKYFINGGNNRVIMATDGDFNVGLSTEAELAAFISEKRDSGIYFSVVGVGRDNYNSAIMETLAKNGNGNHGYIDSTFEARKLFVNELGGTVNTVAKDAKASISFDPEYISAFRPVGYENKLLSQEEFEDDTTDAGEIGSGHKITVVFELKLTEKGKQLNNLSADNLGCVSLSYKLPTASQSESAQMLNMDINASAIHSQPTVQDNFVASVVEFGLVLQNGEYRANSSAEAVLLRLSQLGLSDEYMLDFLGTVQTYLEKYSKDE